MDPTDEEHGGEHPELSEFTGRVMPNGHLVKEKNKARRRKRRPRAVAGKEDTARTRHELSPEVEALLRKRCPTEAQYQASKADLERLLYDATEPRAPGMGENKLYASDLTEAERQQLRKWSKANPACAEQIHHWAQVIQIIRNETATLKDKSRRELASVSIHSALAATRDVIIVCGAGKDLDSILRALGKQSVTAQSRDRGGENSEHNE